jgi:predicted enzyme related to lactoylglutathione lyase
MNANPVGWFEIYVDDIDRAKTFYETVFEVKLENLLAPDESQMWAFPMAQEGSGAAGSLVYMNGVKAGGNSTIVYFSSKDSSIEEARVEDAGGSVFKSKFSIGDYGFITLAFDTERNMFGIHSRQ